MKIIKISMVFFFMVFIYAAIIQLYFSVINVESVNESRTKVEWPQQTPWTGLRDGTGYATAVERFFSDHFPLRDIMLRGLGQFEYSVLGRSREVIIGKDGWLSDKKVLAEQLHQLDDVNDEQIKESVIQLKRLQYWLQDRGVDFLMVIVPMKPTIYAGNFPERYAQRPEQTGLQRFQKALDNNDIPFLNVLGILNEHKSERSLFYKTDMHWNTAGISYVAKDIVDHFSSKILGKRIWNEQIIKSEQEFSGAELSTMPLLFPKSEITQAWTSENQGYTERMVGDGETAIKVYTGTDKTRALLPPSIMFGNSFMLQYPSVGYHNYFSESTRVLDYQFFKNVLDYIKPEHKIFILHIYETQLLFHVLPPDSSNYWDKRIQNLPLPIGFKYK
ncbi:MAG: alginate O-acetyltransferase AlgX-related protein [Methylovulum sp.]